MSKDLSVKNITFPVEFSTLRLSFRNFEKNWLITKSDRQYWWPVFTKQSAAQDSILVYPDVAASAVLKLETASDLCMDKITPGGFKYLTVEDSFYVFTSLYDVQEPELLRPLCRILSGELASHKDGIAIAFAMYGEIFNNASKYMSTSIPAFTAIAHRSRLYAFRKLMATNIPKTFTALEKINGLMDNHLNLIFVHFFSEVIIQSDVLKIIDLYLLEGYKVLYRYALGFFQSYKKVIKAGRFETGEDFWKYAMENKERLSFDALQDLAFEKKVSPLDKAFRTSRFVLSKKRIEDLIVEGKRSLGETGSDPLRLLSIEPVLANTDNIVRYSTLIARDEAALLVEALPSTAQVGGFDLRFATYRDGWNIDTLYSKVATHYPCILVIRTLNCDALIGAYISSPLNPPSKLVRGDGTCFVFRLNGPKKQVFKWALDGRTPTKAQLEDATLNQYAVCSMDFMMFGGDAAHGTNAIFLDEDLRSCVCGRSDTYANPPLVPEAKGQTLQVKDIEILCGRGRMNLFETGRRDQVISIPSNAKRRSNF